jgi:F0F1-type ATP synthase membrane subunit c/vacuolar-type H+-ATPase subunit K
VNKLIALAAGVLCGLAASTAVLGAGVASADSPDDVVGKTYSDATSALNSAGITARVATVVGDKLSQSDCVVTSANKAPFVGGTDAKHVSNTMLLNLNCYAAAASSGSAGYSAASPEGKAAAAAAEEAAAQQQAQSEGAVTSSNQR